jgi:hypothetical protein
MNCEEKNEKNGLKTEKGGIGNLFVANTPRVSVARPQDAKNFGGWHAAPQVSVFVLLYQ